MQRISIPKKEKAKKKNAKTSISSVVNKRLEFDIATYDRDTDDDDDGVIKMNDAEHDDGNSNSLSYDSADDDSDDNDDDPLLKLMEQLPTQSPLLIGPLFPAVTFPLLYFAS